MKCKNVLCSHYITDQETQEGKCNFAMPILGEATEGESAPIIGFENVEVTIDENGKCAMATMPEASPVIPPNTEYAEYLGQFEKAEAVEEKLEESLEGDYKQFAHDLAYEQTR